MKNIFKTFFILIALFGTVEILNAQSNRMNQHPWRQPQQIKAPKKVTQQPLQYVPDYVPDDVAVQDDKLYTEVDELPQFKGGNEALYAWISENIKYPEAAIKNKKEGLVTVEFIVEKDGNISNPIIMKDEVGYGADQEVLKLLEKMPYWSSGKIKDQPVRALYTIPVSFKL